MKKLLLLFWLIASPALAQGVAYVPASPILNFVNPQLYSGADFGAQVNAAIASSCVSVVCPLSGPVSRTVQTFSTAISLGQSDSLSCPYSGGNTGAVQLSYTGSLKAISLAGQGSALFNCSMQLGTSATAGIYFDTGGDGFASLDRAFLTGGGSGTAFISLFNTSNARITNTDIYRKTAGSTSIYLQQTNDSWFSGNLAYGPALGGVTDLTSEGMVLDSGAHGTTVDGMLGGFTGGLHGLLVENVGNPGIGPPNELDFTHYFIDCVPGGSGMYFDSSLSTTGMRSVIGQSWSAGNGQNCNTTSVATAAAHGMEFQGGSQMINYAMRLRANTGAGYYDNTAGEGMILAISYVGSNCVFTPACTYSGAEYTSAATGFLNLGNYYSTANDVGPAYEQYGVNVASAGFGIVAENVCGTLIIGCIHEQDTGKVAYWNNISEPGQTDPPNRVFGDVLVASDVSRTVGAHLVPNFGSTANFLMGAGSNLYFDPVASRFKTGTDGTTNGGAGWFFSSNASASTGLYVCPSTGTTGQSLTAAQLITTCQQVSFAGGFWNFVGVPNFLSNAIFKNGADTAQFLTFQSGTTASQNEGLQFNNFSGTDNWRVYNDANQIFHLADIANNKDRFWIGLANATVIQSESTFPVEINAFSGSGTGGLQIGNGAGSVVATINGAGAGSWATQTFTALPSDATHTDNSLCGDSSSGVVYKGSGTLGICLGTSSARYKNNIQAMGTAAMPAVLQLRPSSYRYKKGYGDDGKKSDYWLIAEETQKALPQCVPLDKGGKPMSVDPICVETFMLKAMQEQQRTIGDLQRKIAALEPQRRVAHDHR